MNDAWNYDSSPKISGYYHCITAPYSDKSIRYFDGRQWLRVGSELVEGFEDRLCVVCRPLAWRVM